MKYQFLHDRFVIVQVSLRKSIALRDVPATITVCRQRGVIEVMLPHAQAGQNLEGISK